MIIHKVCSCGSVIRENGDGRFNDSVISHFKNSHSGEFKLMNIIARNANKEFQELKSKYPELTFSFSNFDIDFMKLLDKKRHV